MQITSNFSLEELINSDKANYEGISNVPNEVQMQNLFFLAEKLLQPLRDALGMAIKVNSGFRCEMLNKLLNGAHKIIKGKYFATSQHCHGCAADLTCANNRDLFVHVRDNMVFDQLIWEMGDDNQPEWVHVSLVRKHNRGEVLRAYRTEGGTHYEVI